MADDILEILEIGLTLRLVESGLCDTARATEVVGEFVAETRESYGGTRWMIKRGYRRYSPRVVARIRAAYNGRNEAALRDRHGMSRTTFYNLIRKKSG